MACHNQAEFERMSTEEMNKCLSKFCVSAKNYYKEISLLSMRTALDRHLKAPPNTTNKFQYATPCCSTKQIKLLVDI